MSITVKKTLKIRNKTTNQFEPLAALRGRDGADGQQGPQGISGATGPQGPAGEDGHTPTTEEIEEVCADALADITTELEEAKRKIKFLDEMSKGQLYDFEEKSESGTSVSPSGAKYQSLLAVDGKTEQTKWNGYNLFSNQADEIVDNLYLTQNGSAVGFQGYNYSVVLNCDANTTYTISREVISERFRVASVASIPTVGTASTDAKQVSDGGSSVTITTTDTSRYLIINLSTVMTTFRNQLASLMVEKGSTAHSYEPYVGGIPSPNPSYPQDIKGVEELNVKVGSRNIVKNALMDNKANAFTDVLCVDADLKPNTTYVLSFDDVANHKCYLNENLFKVQSYIVTDGNRYSIVCTTKDTISTESGIQYTANRGWRILKNQEANTVTPNVTNVMIEYGSTAHPYEPFSEETRTIIPPKPLYKVGDYVDRLDVNSGEWVYANEHEHIARFQSALNVSYTALFKFVVKKQNIRNSYNDIALSDMFTGKPISLWDTRTESFAMQTVPTIGKEYRCTYIALGNIISLDEMNALIPNGFEVYYPLAEPETSPINAEDLEWLKSFDGISTDKVWSVTDQDGNDVSYLLKYIVKTSEV